MPPLEARGITKVFTGGDGRALPILGGIDFQLSTNETVAIIGASGAGKSTLLRIMAKIYAPAKGAVTWAPGVTVSLLSLGLGFKNELTGRDNAYLAGLLQGLTKNDAKQSLVSIEAFCELGDYFDEPVKTYSAGMRARLGFATALLNNASVLLIDEVLSVGDKEFREKAKLALENELLVRRAIVLVSHTDAQISNLCDSAIFLDNGSVAAEGEASAVLAEYASR